MSRLARTIVPPKTCPIDWCPRQTPRIGIRPANRLTTSQEMPASSGVQGPGEITRWVGDFFAISSPVILSLR